MNPRGRHRRRAGWPRIRRVDSRGGLSLVELLTALVLLGFGLVGLAAGSRWMSGSGEADPDGNARTAALRAAVEEVRAVPFEELVPGARRYGDFEVEWTFLEETPNAVLLRFVVTNAARTPVGAGEGSTQVADTLEYRRTGP